MDARLRIFAAAGLIAAIGLAVTALVVLRPEQDRVVAIPVQVEMTAGRYYYDPANLTIEAGAKVVIRITSIDVTHGFAIREYGIDVRIPPGETVTVTFVADEPGIFEIFCTVFCGSGHPQHRGRLTVTA